MVSVGSCRIHPAVKGEVPKLRYYHHAAVINNEEIIVLGGRTGIGLKNENDENAYILKPDLAPKSLQL